MKMKVAMLMAMVFVLAACGPVYSADSGPPTPPSVVGMEWADPPNQNNLDCGIGILTDGSAFVAGALGHPFLAAGITWLGWYTTSEQYPPGGSIIGCWNSMQGNLGAFNLYTQCFGDPVLKSTWTSFSGAQAWVSIPSCRQCNQACVAFANAANPAFDLKASWCDDPSHQMDLVCFALAHPQNGASMATQIPGTESELPWPSDMVPPGWDTTIPIPI
jgi:hypothetical protein